MHRVSSSFAIALVAAAPPPLAGTSGAQAPARTKGPQVVAHTVDVSKRQATLGLELADGGKVRITLARGVLRVNDREAGRYSPGGALEESWRSLLNDAASLPTADLRTRMAGWKVAGLSGADLAVKQQIDAAFTRLPAIAP